LHAHAQRWQGVWRAPCFTKMPLFATALLSAMPQS
jgi:hypothetical protein